MHRALVEGGGWLPVCSVESDIRKVVDLTAANFGPVDMYFANAGVGVGQGLGATDGDWHVATEVNVVAHVRAARVLMPTWLERGRGYFFATASASGLLTQLGSPTYSATKHAAVAFAEWLAITYGGRGIVVSCLCPMGVNTAMLSGGAASDDADANLSARAVSTAGRVVEALDVADVAMEAVQDERFLVTPHPEVLEFTRRKGADHDRWIRGMQRYHESIS